MKFSGSWACVDLFNCSLDIFDDGSALITIAENCLFFATPDFFVETDNGVVWTYRGYSCSLKKYGDDLSGICVLPVGSSRNVTFTRLPLPPERYRMHVKSAVNSLPSPDAAFGGDAVFLRGKWTEKDFYGGCTLNFTSKGDCVGLKISFQGGYSFFEPVSFWFEDGALIWQINDANNRGRCVLRRDGADLVGTYRQQYHDTFPPMRFIKVSDEPEDGEMRSFDEQQLPDGKSRADVLRDYANYATDEPHAVTEYTLGGDIPDALARLGFAEAIAGKSGDALAFACLDFVDDNFKHDGSSGMPSGRSAANIIDYCSEHDGKINCRGLALLLSSCLRYAGIRAQHVTCMPYEEPFNDCHVVVDCLLPSGARVMLDPTYRLWLTSGSEYVSLPALRRILIADGELIPCERAGYNGGSFDIDNYRMYMTKNTFRFSKGRVNADGFDERDGMVLLPLGYNETERDKKYKIYRDDSAFWGE